MKKKIAIMVTSLLVVLVLAGCSNENFGKNDQKNIPGAEQRQDPPAELSSACQGKNEGDGCEVSMPQRDNSGSSNKISGTCKKAPSGDQLSCMPQGGQGAPGGSGRQGSFGKSDDQASNINTEN
ncbi:MAG: hypothetical protein Athens101428_140 [Candidatus Berkelbacteria bacterium Athens1014_28]|uniref:Lipoprotein n=1 Tax=Candidatus Berkelbacteria bacterium Athens1014_28 TaxID=2017145 RepID=A0A554LPQ4_9BACT|nr:MAG: hypothetical protein Athens101428_140 [Candidatus Berkelbacteria bacterium Athens1014_28]